MAHTDRPFVWRSSAKSDFLTSSFPPPVTGHRDFSIVFCSTYINHVLLCSKHQPTTSGTSVPMVSSIFDDPNGSISFDTIDNNDEEEENLFANTAVQDPCHAAALSENPTTLETRDSLCSPGKKKSPSSPGPLLPPESIHLFQDPDQILNELFLPSSCSDSPSEPLESPLYPGYLTPEQERDRTDEDRVWDLDGMGLTQGYIKFYCPNPYCNVLVICDGPFDAIFDLTHCDLGKVEKKHFFLTLYLSLASSLADRTTQPREVEKGERQWNWLETDLVESSNSIRRYCRRITDCFLTFSFPGLAKRLTSLSPFNCISRNWSRPIWLYRAYLRLLC